MGIHLRRGDEKVQSVVVQLQKQTFLLMISMYSQNTFHFFLILVWTWCFKPFNALVSQVLGWFFCFCFPWSNWFPLFYFIHFLSFLLKEHVFFSSFYFFTDIRMRITFITQPYVHTQGIWLWFHSHYTHMALHRQAQQAQQVNLNIKLLCTDRKNL